MRLNIDLLNNAPSYINPAKERELDLRGHKIPTIENLGVTKDQNDAIDFTDNDIRFLGNFPKLIRIRTLLLSRNRISSISSQLPSTLPNLRTLILTSNSISELSDIRCLSGLRKLTFLSLMDNPVSRKENYRLWVVWICSSLRVLDFSKVRQCEREAAKVLFGVSISEPTALAQSILGVKSHTFDNDESMDEGRDKFKLTDDERKRIQDAIRSATSMGQVIKLEAMLNEADGLENLNSKKINGPLELKNYKDTDHVIHDFKKILTYSEKDNTGLDNIETPPIKIHDHLDDYSISLRTFLSSGIKKDYRRSKSSSPRKPLQLKKNINDDNLFNISKGVKSMQDVSCVQFSAAKILPSKKIYSESTTLKKPWTPQRIILQKENESLKKYINELKKALKEKKEGFNNYVDNNIIKRLRDLIDFIQIESNIYLETKDSELKKTLKEFEEIKLENEKLKKENSYLLKMWNLEKDRVKRREKQLGVEQMRNKQISAQLGILEEAMMNR
ncbi:hypothetical protein MERGE_002404 [Pneumocystis wakefieldiae]|uniref:U2 small nuclear ribonucleoprotein A' n=1 Tax=Pneumocystis wakefieldiae TaxID=38082 RepID=A0A899G0S7_9ASCO|nr:hypothetical protein MERGE_002404 [Pneumocystis wakefieldiae]